MGYVVVHDCDPGPECAYSVEGGTGKATIFAASRTVYTPMRFMVTEGQDDRDPDAGPPVRTPLHRQGA